MTPIDFRRILGCAFLAGALVFAGCGDGGNNAMTPDDDVVVDTTPPAVPADLAVHGVRNVGIVVEWAENSEPDLQGYVLQRSLDSGTTWESVPGCPLVPAYFEDIFWTRADYRVAAVDNSENQSAYSAPRVFTAPPGDGPKYPQKPLEPHG